MKGKASKKIAVLVGSVFILFVLLIFLWVLSWSKPWNPGELQEGIPDPRLSDEFSLSLEESTFPSMISELKMKLINHTNKERFTGCDIILEVQLNGKWYRIPEKKDFPLVAAVLEPNSTRESYVYVYQHFGKLPKGHYRCSKEIGQWEDATYACAEFDVV